MAAVTTLLHASCWCSGLLLDAGLWLLLLTDSACSGVEGGAAAADLACCWSVLAGSAAAVLADRCCWGSCMLIRSVLIRSSSSMLAWPGSPSGRLRICTTRKDQHSARLQGVRTV